MFLLAVSASPPHITAQQQPIQQVSLPDQTESTIRLGVLTHFVHRVSNKHDSEIKFSKCMELAVGIEPTTN